MKLSKTGMGNTKLNNLDEMYPGQSILLQTGQMVQYGAGIFGYTSLEELPELPRYKLDENQQIVIEDIIEPNEAPMPEREDIEESKEEIE